MNNESPKPSRPVSTRTTIDEFAKVLDSLLAKGISEDNLRTNSNIVKTALRLLIANSPNPAEPATQRSIDTIKQIWKIDKLSESFKI